MCGDSRGGGVGRGEERGAAAVAGCPMVPLPPDALSALELSPEVLGKLRLRCAALGELGPGLALLVLEVHLEVLRKRREVLVGQSGAVHSAQESEHVTIVAIAASELDLHLLLGVLEDSGGLLERDIARIIVVEDGDLAGSLADGGLLAARALSVEEAHIEVLVWRPLVVVMDVDGDRHLVLASREIEGATGSHIVVLRVGVTIGGVELH